MTTINSESMDSVDPTGERAKPKQTRKKTTQDMLLPNTYNFIIKIQDPFRQIKEDTQKN